MTVTSTSDTFCSVKTMSARFWNSSVAFFIALLIRKLKCMRGNNIFFSWLLQKDLANSQPRTFHLLKVKQPVKGIAHSKYTERYSLFVWTLITISFLSVTSRQTSLLEKKQYYSMRSGSPPYGRYQSDITWQALQTVDRVTNNEPPISYNNLLWLNLKSPICECVVWKQTKSNKINKQHHWRSSIKQI